MNTPFFLKNLFFDFLQKQYQVDQQTLARIDFIINSDADRSTHGDISSNAALVIAKIARKSPRVIATEIIAIINDKHGDQSELASFCANIDAAGPGFLNIQLSDQCWHQLTEALLKQPEQFFIEPETHKKKILVEFVSANPTGPLHLGHGRGGIIGDVLMRIGRFLGHRMSAEFYINDAGSQMSRLGESLRARVLQELGKEAELPEQGYAGEYLVTIAQKIISLKGAEVINEPLSFFTKTAQQELQEVIKTNLKDYRIEFDNWFSEKSLHDSGAITDAINQLTSEKIIYESEGALWFKSTDFGDDKDRVIRKKNGDLTYIAADIAYHKNKFDRGYDQMIDIMGQDHHGYVARLKAVIQALGYDAKKLNVILYQLVSMKKGETLLKMSKRAGNFEQLGDVIKLVGADVARFFYLNRKGEAHLEFDLDVALKTTDENPVFYIHYAYVRTGSILKKATEHAELASAMSPDKLSTDQLRSIINIWQADERLLLKKIWALHSVLPHIMETYQTHVLAYYTYELAQRFHHYYAQNHVIDRTKPELSAARLTMISMVRSTLSLCLDLLGLSKPEAM